MAPPPSHASEVHDWIDREQVVERYVQNRLEGADLERFEQHYMSCDACVERLELAERFQGSLRWVVAEEANRALEAAALAWWTRWLSRRGILAALTFVLFLLPAGLAWRLTGERDQLGETLDSLRAPATISSIARLDTLRSDPGEPPAVQLLPPAEGEKLLLELETEPGTVYDARLSDSDGTTLWQGSRLTSAADGRLRLVLGREALGQGAHTLELTSKDSPSEPLLYDFLLLEATTP